MKNYPVNLVTLPNGETIAYREAGQGEQTVVLLHGNMSSSLFFDTLMEQMEADYKLIAFDMRGFGDSSYNRPITSLLDLAQDVVQASEALGLKSFSMLGWSTGGGVALELAASRPDLVDRVILVNSVSLTGYPMFKKDAAGQPKLTERITTREEVATDPVQVLPILHAYATDNKELLRSVWNALIYHEAKPCPQRYERYLEAMLKQRNLVDVDYALITFNMTAAHNGVVAGTGRIDLVQAPVLVVQGENDRVVPLAWAKDTAAALGSKAALHMLPGVGHSPFTDSLDELVALLSAYLR
ncbi:MAG: Non-heme chloroperoxidase [Firmicutes bacterium]|nr:Non-heme chloroperoxidase [Bacillota bacterium]